MNIFIYADDHNEWSTSYKESKVSQINFVNPAYSIEKTHLSK